jgi:DNA/RNA-binding domain of Phe-tRNA-synthetase-like protein
MNEILKISIDPALAGTIRLGWFRMDGVAPQGPTEPLDTDLEALSSRLRQEYATPAEAGPRNRPARVLYRAVGIDPTKYRPSSEALLRRVLTGKPLYRINRVVDGANICSLEAALPVGLYDTDLLRGDLLAGLGGPGDGYEGIGKGRVNLEGRLMLADHQGPFGNPSSDSFRTRVRDETRNILFIFFAPAETSHTALERITGEAADRMAGYTGGHLLGQGIEPVRG